MGVEDRLEAAERQLAGLRQVQTELVQEVVVLMDRVAVLTYRSASYMSLIGTFCAAAGVPPALRQRWMDSLETGREADQAAQATGALIAAIQLHGRAAGSA
jgi:hypothetical protein